MNDLTPLEKLRQRSSWYGNKAAYNRARYSLMKSTQIVLAAAIPVIAVVLPADTQKWLTAILGASIGVMEGLIQLGQYQQNWLLYRATRESLNREEFLYEAKIGPYAGISSPEALYYERCDTIMSGENSKWLASQQQAASKK